jgi:cytosine/adenosine deaminase-related metal-dependent hydrolase
MGESNSGGETQTLMTARQALEIATLGGAAVLGRPDLGSLEKGKCGDLFAINLNRLEYAGGLHDPVSALIFCAPVKADYTIVAGKVIVKEGQLMNLDIPRLVEKHNRAARRLINGSD